MKVNIKDVDPQKRGQDIKTDERGRIICIKT
jgi:hypothetical protein